MQSQIIWTFLIRNGEASFWVSTVNSPMFDGSKYFTELAIKFNLKNSLTVHI